jgi:hypothetical protein
MTAAAVATAIGVQPANDDTAPERIEANGLYFTREQVEDGSLSDGQADRIVDHIAKDIYFERYQPENRVRDLSETAEVAEALFDRYSAEPRADALRKLGQYGNCINWLYDEEIIPAVRSLREEIQSGAEEMEWMLDLGLDEDDFDHEIAACVEDRLNEKDHSTPTDMLSSCDRVEVAFVLMPRARNIYPDDYSVNSHKAWSDWEHLGIDQGLLEALPRLGYTLGEYRRHSKNRHERGEPLSRHPRRRPLATLDELQELVENACSSHFNFAIYAQVPLARLLETDLDRPVVLDRYSLCVFSDNSGTFHSIERGEPIVLNPEDGIWKAFGKSGPSNWCGLSNRYFQADIRN